MSAPASLTVAKLQPTCPGLETGDCEVLRWDDAGNVTARDTRTGPAPPPALEWTAGETGAPIVEVPLVRVERYCEAIHPSGLGCTRPAGHTRRHANAGMFRVYAVWRQA